MKFRISDDTMSCSTARVTLSRSRQVSTTRTARDDPPRASSKLLRKSYCCDPPCGDGSKLWENPESSDLSAVATSRHDSADGKSDPRPGNRACGSAELPRLEIDLGNFTVVLDPADYARLEFIDEDGNADAAPDAVADGDSAPEATAEAAPAEGSPAAILAQDSRFRESGMSAAAGDVAGAEQPAEPPSCVPMVMHIDLPPPLHPRTLILGEPVLQRYYTVFDASTSPKVGFAPALHQAKITSRDRDPTEAEAALQADAR
eukprot:s352_g4.t1